MHYILTMLLTIAGQPAQLATERYETFETCKAAAAEWLAAIKAARINAEWRARVSCDEGGQNA